VLEEPITARDNTDRRSQRHEATKAEILAAAWELVRREGLAALSLRDVARTVGMQAPSLYQYFGSKHAIYDAMFAQGYRALLEWMLPDDTDKDTRAKLKRRARMFIDFCVEDPARYQLLFQRTIPGFEPSAESYALAVEALTHTRHELGKAGLTDPALLDLWTAVITGLTDQQISNDPGGDRWLRLVDEAVDMLIDHFEKQKRRRK
jgi:AcrR family transcriptional regulator